MVLDVHLDVDSFVVYVTAISVACLILTVACGRICDLLYKFSTRFRNHVNKDEVRNDV